MSYALYVGRALSGAGHAWLAGYGDEPSGHWLQVSPGRDHAPGATITVGVTPQADLPGRLSEIPQAARTARHMGVNYSHYLGAPAPLTNGGVNEHGVAVRDVWSPSRPELVAMTPPDQTGPNYSDLARIVLERARSAREGVEIIGALIAAHGHSSYGGNSHLIADAEEGWLVVEFAGGLGLWVAERLGPHDIRAARPGHVGLIAQEPDGEVLYSERFIETAQRLGWHVPGTPFDVNRVYGDGRGRRPGSVWIEEEMTRRAARPGGLTLSDMIWAVATPRLTGDSAGYGQIVPLQPDRPAMLRMMWHAPSGPVTTPLVPVFLGIDHVPPEYDRRRHLGRGESARFVDRASEVTGEDAISEVPQGVVSTRAAIAVFKRLMHLAFQGGEPWVEEISAHWRRVERGMAEELDDVRRSAEILIAAEAPDLARRLLDEHVRTRLLRVLAEAEALAAGYEARLRAGPGLNMGAVPKGPDRIW
ncbi:C69 family dipeptidase [Limimaricola litoreus]|uniref:Dipeptidase n=1 Tax=Limimaricola litoreus TaxID=2955316 RepID=A0A9X2JN18_9RHOB|nr:C69 family dipeptidase [Limimaricola litoreus]MCP1167758.1 C69 family dipeptidase [Limimaricola litoreus]